jgi:hypothetical protein
MIDPLPTPAPTRDMSEDDFVAAMNALLAALPGLVSQTNAALAAFNAAVSGGGITIPYTFSATTTDSDPGTGRLRLSNATQNASTVIRVNLNDALTNDYTAVLDSLDDSTSTIKGQLRLIKVSDGTKFLLFDITAVNSASGYRNISVTCTGGSGTSPFTDSDVLLMCFSRTGDKGLTGATGPSGSIILLETINPSAAATVTTTASLSSTYDTYMIELVDIRCSAGTPSLNMLLNISGGGFATADYDYSSAAIDTGSVSSSGGTAAAAISIGTVPSAANLALNGRITLRLPSGTSRRKPVEFDTNTTSPRRTVGTGNYTASNGAITAVRLETSTGATLTGSVRVYALAN